MSLHTTFKIGGTADYFLQPTTLEEIRHAMKVCKEENLPYYVIGNGSNLLVTDKGYRGAIIQIYKNYDFVKIEDTIVEAGAGVNLGALAKKIAKNSLQGFEFAAGIPGTLGGALYMNAGAYGGEMKQVVQSVTLLNEQGEIETLLAKDLEFGYRYSVFHKKNYIALSARMNFEKGKEERIEQEISMLNRKRREKQPLEFPSAGSTFKRPEGYYAGKLIMDAGLKGYTIGGACVAEKHCGFVINKENATFEDVQKLIEHVQKVVYEKFGVHLEQEVRIIGER